jgi:hypothetical protein
MRRQPISVLRLITAQTIATIHQPMGIRQQSEFPAPAGWYTGSSPRQKERRIRPSQTTARRANQHKHAAAFFLDIAFEATKKTYLL